MSSYLNKRSIQEVLSIFRDSEHEEIRTKIINECTEGFWLMHSKLSLGTDKSQEYMLEIFGGDLYKIKDKIIISKNGRSKQERRADRELTNIDRHRIYRSACVGELWAEYLCQDEISKTYGNGKH